MSGWGVARGKGLVAPPLLFLEKNLKVTEEVCTGGGETEADTEVSWGSRWGRAKQVACFSRTLE